MPINPVVHQRSLVAVAFATQMAILGCSPRADGCSGDSCGTLVFPAPGKLVTLLPVVSNSATDRDIFDQIFLKLADVGPEGGTIGDKGFEPQLASKWEWNDSLTLTFHLDPRARWQDAFPVTAGDVAFTFAAYNDTAVASPHKGNLNRIGSVVAKDSSTVVFTFTSRYSEMFFDAVHHMRILPAHLLKAVPYSQWHSAPFGRAPIGNGPYRFVSWTSGQSVELAADSTFFLGRPHLRRLIWRFTPDLAGAITQLVAGEADAFPSMVTPTNIDRATKSGHLTLYKYPGSLYSYLVFNFHANGDRSKPHPLFGDPELRRALLLATDRNAMLQSVFAGHAKVPPGPISQVWSSLWFPDLQVAGYDTTQANKLLDKQGWQRTKGDSIRVRNGIRLSFHLAVSNASGPRMQYSQLIQEEWRAVGVEVVIDQMEPATMGAKEKAGAFDAALEGWGTDPTPSADLPNAWTTKGEVNSGRYSNPVFDNQVSQAVSAADPAAAARAWHDALVTWNQDVPAIMLYALENVAAVDSRFTDVRLRPDYWWAYVWTWKIPSDKLTDRDRVVR